MALSAGLQLRQSQSLVMTPQLMQSIRLLQFSHVELTRFIEQEVERNPLLELVSSDNDQSDPVSEAAEPAKPQAAEGDQGEDASWAGNADSQAERMTSEIDARYENVFPDDHGTERVDQPEFIDNWKSMPGSDGGRSGEGYDLDDFAARAPTLRDHVAEQIAFAFAEPAERLIATELADQLDAAGYMVGDMAETVERLSADPEQVEGVLARLQEFEPAGLFARSLSECLALQLARKNRLDPAMAALVNNLELLARRDFAALTRICGVDEEDLLDMMAEIRALDPKPGTRFETGSSE
jgi:RNA polymerase sigma-54 factor